MAVDSSSAHDPHPTPALPERVIEDLLADPRRESMVRSLYERTEPVTMHQLAADAIARERSVSPAEVSHSERQEVCEKLYERHLPKLTALCVLSYNPRHASVELDAAAPQVAAYLFENNG